MTDERSAAEHRGMEELITVLGSSAPVVILTGDLARGNTERLEAAAAALTAAGTPALVAPLDLDGWEPDLPVSGRPVGMWAAAVAALRRTVEEKLDTETAGRETMRGLLEELVSRRRLVLAIDAPELVPDPLAEELIQAAGALPGLTISIACKERDLLGRIWASLVDGAPRIRLTAASEELVIERWEEAIEARLPGGATRLRGFLQLAGLCGEHVPAGPVLECLGLDADEANDFLDFVDEHLTGDGKDALFVDLEYGHPSFPEHLVYRFARSSARRAVRDALPFHDASRAPDLLEILRASVAPASRGGRRLLAVVADGLGESGLRDRALCELAWWVGEDDAEALSETLVAAVRDGRLAPERLWETLEGTSGIWPGVRRQALATAYLRQPGGVPDHRQAAFRLLEAEILGDLGETTAALEAAREGLAMIERSGGPAASRAAAELRIGRLFTDLQDFDSAHEHLGRALELADDGDVADERWILGVLHDSAVVDLRLGAAERARGVLERALVLSRRHGASHARTADLLRLYADALGRVGDLEGVRAALEQALELEAAGYADVTCRRTPVLSQLADVHTEMGDLAAARACLEQALAAAAEGRGESSTQVAVLRHRLIDLLIELGDREAAAIWLREAIAVTREEHGRLSPEVSTALKMLADQECERGNATAQAACLEEALAADVAVLGEDHPDVVVLLKTLADLEWERGDRSVSVERRQRVLAIEKRLYGEQHPRLQPNLAKLAFQLEQTGA